MGGAGEGCGAKGEGKGGREGGWRREGPSASGPSLSHHWPEMGHMPLSKPIPGKGKELLITGLN